MYRLKIFIAFTVTLTVSMYITYFYSINNLMRVFTTPIFVCVTEYLILKDDFARKSARTALFISLLVCMVSRYGKGVELILLFQEKDWSSLWTICVGMAFSTSILIATRNLILSITGRGNSTVGTQNDASKNGNSDLASRSMKRDEKS